MHGVPDPKHAAYVRSLLLDLLTDVSDLPEDALLIHHCRDNAPKQDVQTGIDVVGARLALHKMGTPVDEQNEVN